MPQAVEESTSLEQVKNLRVHQELAGEDVKVQDQKIKLTFSE